MAIELLKMQSVAGKVKHFKDIIIQLGHNTNKEINRNYVNFLFYFQLKLI